MDYSIRKKWLMAFWINWGAMILLALATLRLDLILGSLILMGVTYYCSYKKYGTWWLSFLLILFYISLGILALQGLQTFSLFDFIFLGLNIYYSVWCYRLRAFNRLYRHKLFTEQI